MNLNIGGSYKDSPDSIKTKKAIINPIIKKGYKSSSVALNHGEIGKHSERMTKIKPFINKYNWEKINFPSEKDDWRKIEKNNLIIAINICMLKKKK